MNYVEWLRVRNTLRVLAIVLGVFVLCGLILRISVAHYLTYDAWIGEIQKHPGVTAVQTTAPDGARRLTVDDSKEQTHIVVDDYGFKGKQIVITEPESRARAEHEHEHANFGSIEVRTTQAGDISTTVVNTNGSVPMLYYMLVADLIALIIATIFGVSLARENDGHLEVAMTRPASRVRLALGIMGADIVGILAASLMAVLMQIVIQSMFEVPSLNFSGVNTEAIIMGIVLPVAWYALFAAATASLKRGYIGVLLVTLGVAIVVPSVARILAAIQSSGSTILPIVRGFFWAVSRLDPLSYVSFSAGQRALETGNAMVANPDFALRLSILILLFVVYSAIAIAQWRRVEA